MRARRNRESHYAAVRRAQLKKSYGITPEEYDALLAAQGGVCKICNQSEMATRNGVPMRMPVDHCHTTGRVRGLLCSLCNKGLGSFRDDTEILKHAIRYLEEVKQE